MRYWNSKEKVIQHWTEKEKVPEHRHKNIPSISHNAVVLNIVIDLANSVRTMVEPSYSEGLQP